jgi:hypothetical protein
MRKGTTILALAALTTAILVCGEEALAKEKDKKTVTLCSLQSVDQGRAQARATLDRQLCSCR